MATPEELRIKTNLTPKNYENQLERNLENPDHCTHRHRGHFGRDELHDVAKSPQLGAFMVWLCTKRQSDKVASVLQVEFSYVFLGIVV